MGALAATPLAAMPKDTQNCFEKILGVRRGHIRGIGRKPSTVVSMYDQEQPLTQPPPQS